MLVYTDDKHVVYGKDPKIGRVKNAMTITVAQESIRCDNLSIRNAEPRVDWEQSKFKTRH